MDFVFAGAANSLQDKDENTKVAQIAKRSGLHITPGGPDDDFDDLYNVNDDDDEKKTNNNDDDNDDNDLLLLDIGALNMILSKQKSQFVQSEYSIMELKNEFESIFDKYFDSEHNTDIDINEFRVGLTNVGLQLNNEQSTNKLFDLLSQQNCDEQSEFVQREQFSEFLLAKYDFNVKIHELQQTLLNAITPFLKQSNALTKSNKNMVSAESPSRRTSAFEEDQMRQHVAMLAQEHMRKQQNDSDFQTELLKRATANNANNDISNNNDCNMTGFCVTENALDWDCYEVAYWLEQCGFAHFVKKKFFDFHINGSKLVYDIKASDKRLLDDLGIKTVLDQNTFERHLNDLRKQVIPDEVVCDGQLPQTSPAFVNGSNSFNGFFGGVQSDLVLDLNIGMNVHIDSETMYQMEQHKTELQSVQLQAFSENNALQKHVNALIEQKSVLNDKMVNDKHAFEQEKQVLLMQIEAVKEENDAKFKKKESEVRTLKRKNEKLNRKKQDLIAINEELQIQQNMNNNNRNTPGDDDDGASENVAIYLCKIDNLESQLRIEKMEKDKLNSELERMQHNMRVLEERLFDSKAKNEEKQVIIERSQSMMNVVRDEGIHSKSSRARPYKSLRKIHQKRSYNNGNDANGEGNRLDEDDDDDSADMTIVESD